MAHLIFVYNPDTKLLTGVALGPEGTWGYVAHGINSVAWVNNIGFFNEVYAEQHIDPNNIPYTITFNRTLYIDYSQPVKALPDGTIYYEIGEVTNFAPFNPSTYLYQLHLNPAAANPAILAAWASFEATKALQASQVVMVPQQDWISTMHALQIAAFERMRADNAEKLALSEHKARKAERYRRIAAERANGTPRSGISSPSMSEISRPMSEASSTGSAISGSTMVSAYAEIPTVDRKVFKPLNEPILEEEANVPSKPASVSSSSSSKSEKIDQERFAELFSKEPIAWESIYRYFKNYQKVNKKLKPLIVAINQLKLDIKTCASILGREPIDIQIRALFFDKLLQYPNSEYTVFDLNQLQNMVRKESSWRDRLKSRIEQFKLSDEYKTANAKAKPVLSKLELEAAVTPEVAEAKQEQVKVQREDAAINQDNHDLHSKNIASKNFTLWSILFDSNVSLGRRQSKIVLAKFDTDQKPKPIDLLGNPEFHNKVLTFNKNHIESLFKLLVKLQKSGNETKARSLVSGINLSADLYFNMLASPDFSYGIKCEILLKLFELEHFSYYELCLKKWKITPFKLFLEHLQKNDAVLYSTFTEYFYSLRTEAASHLFSLIENGAANEVSQFVSNTKGTTLLERNSEGLLALHCAALCMPNPNILAMLWTETYQHMLNDAEDDRQVPYNLTSPLHDEEGMSFLHYLMADPNIDENVVLKILHKMLKKFIIIDRSLQTERVEINKLLNEYYALNLDVFRSVDFQGDTVLESLRKKQVAWPKVKAVLQSVMLRDYILNILAVAKPEGAGKLLNQINIAAYLEGLVEPADMTGTCSNLFGQSPLRDEQTVWPYMLFILVENKQISSIKPQQIINLLTQAGISLVYKDLRGDNILHQLTGSSCQELCQSILDKIIECHGITAIKKMLKEQNQAGYTPYALANKNQNIFLCRAYKSYDGNIRARLDA